MENCIFCKIINKQIPSSVVYEDDVVVAFLDISQATKGHTLVLPKKHYSNLLEIDEETLAQIVKVAKHIASSMIDSLGAKGFNLVNNCNEVAGQSVMHFHLHIIPRYEHDEFIIGPKDNNSKYDLKEIQEKIKNGLANRYELVNKK